MKIYPSNHVICEESRPQFLDIPLAHVEKHYIPKKIVVEPSPEFVHSETKYIAPYQLFDDNDSLIFADDGNISDTELTKKDGKYIYLPSDAKEYTPTAFDFTAVLQRNDTIKSDRNYDFKIGVYKQDGAKKFAQNLMSIFGDAPYRGICPSNIFVNSGSINVENMLKTSGYGLDFLFVQGSSTEFLKDMSDAIPYNELFKSHANIWLTLTDAGCQKWFSMIGENTEDELHGYHIRKLLMEDNTFRSSTSKEESKYDIYVNSENYGWQAGYDKELKMFSKQTFRYLMPTKMQEQSPVFILYKPNGCYIVISNEKMFDHLDIYSSYIYDILQELYIRSFFQTKSRSLWITDDPVDYMGSIDVPLRRSQPPVNINDIVAEDAPGTQSFTLQRIDTSSDGVYFERRTENGDLYFKKTSKSDPERQLDETSVFTYKHTVLCYKGHKDKLVESGVKFGTSIDGVHCYLSVLPFASSKYRLLSSESPVFELTDISRRYVVRALPINTDGVSIVDVVPEDENTSSSAVILATVYMEYEGEATAYDIRQLGGGLPEEYTDYDMIDIGNMKGRPYRVGTGAVITLPKAYEKYDERIRKAVESYKVAADQFYIIYRDE